VHSEKQFHQAQLGRCLVAIRNERHLGKQNKKTKGTTGREEKIVQNVKGKSMDL